MTKSARYPNSLFYCWLAILLWSPLPVASNRPWALALLIMLCVLLSFLTLAYSLWKKMPVLELLRPYAVPVTLLGILAAWTSIQLLPIPLDVLTTISPNAAEIWTATGTSKAPITLTPSRTTLMSAWSWLLWFYVCLAFLFLDNGNRVQQTCMVIVYSGVFQALYGSFMTLTGLEYSFFFEKEFYRGVATGTFVNRNHLAGYLEMCLAVGIGMLVATLKHGRHQNWRSQMRSILDAMLGAKLRLRIFLALMVIALVLTHSRMGNSAFFTSLMICGLLWMILQRKLHKGAIILFVSLVLIDTLIVGQWFGFQEVVDRIENTSADRETRDEVVRDTIVMIRNYPVTGTGLGSYASAFQQFQGPDVIGFYDHAHNDYLQFTAELGLIGMTPLAILVALSLWKSVLTMFRRRNNLYKGVAFASTMGIISLLIHSTVDFNLQMPANAQLFVCILAFAWIASALKHEHH